MSLPAVSPSRAGGAFTCVRRMVDQHGNGGTRITNAEIFSEVRQLGREVHSVRQTLDEYVKPALTRHAAALEESEKQLLSLNVKFYGVLAGGTLTGLALLAQAFGWL